MAAAPSSMRTAVAVAATAMVCLFQSLPCAHGVRLKGRRTGADWDDDSIVDLVSEDSDDAGYDHGRFGIFDRVPVVAPTFTPEPSPFSPFAFASWVPSDRWPIVSPYRMAPVIERALQSKLPKELTVDVWRQLVHRDEDRLRAVLPNSKWIVIYVDDAMLAQMNMEEHHNSRYERSFAQLRFEFGSIIRNVEAVDAESDADGTPRSFAVELWVDSRAIGHDPTMELVILYPSYDKEGFRGIIGTTTSFLRSPPVDGAEYSVNLIGDHLSVQVKFPGVGGVLNFVAFPSERTQSAPIGAGPPPPPATRGPAALGVAGIEGAVMDLVGAGEVEDDETGEDGQAPHIIPP